MALFRKNPSPPSLQPAEPDADEAPLAIDALEAAQIADAAASEAIALARAEVEAAAADAVRAADYSSFPGDDTAAAVAQLVAQRAAARRTAAAADALAGAEAAKVGTASTLARELHADLIRAAESFHWGLEWAGRALLAGVQATPEGRPVQGLAAAVALCRQAIRDRSALQVELTEAGISPPAAPRLSIAAALADLLAPEPGLLGVYLSAANVVRWEADASQRAAAQDAADKQAEQTRRADQARLDLAGHRGPVAKAEAEAEQRAALAAFYAAPALASIIAPASPLPEVA